MPGKSKSAIVQEEHENPHQKIIANQVTDLLKGTIEIVTEYRCKYHPGLAATAVCEVCRADLCPDCSNIRSHKLVCPKCMGALDKALGGTGVAAYCAKHCWPLFSLAWEAHNERGCSAQYPIMRWNPRGNSD